MRLNDVLRPYLDDIRIVVETHAGSISMKPYLHLPDGVEYVRRTSNDDAGIDGRSADLGAGHILELAIFGPDPMRHGHESDVLEVLRRLRRGGRCVILFGYETDELPFHRLLDALTAARAQVVQMSSLDYDHIHGAAIVTVPERLEIPRDPAGDAFASTDGRRPNDAVLRRIANEFVFTDFVSRNLRAQLYRKRRDPSRASGRAQEQAAHELALARADLAVARAELGRANAELDQANVEGERALAEVRHAKAEEEQAKAEVERLVADAALVRAEVQEAKVQATRIAGSTSYQLGRTLVETASRRRPIRRLPGSLVRIWRSRGSGPPGGPIEPSLRTTGERSTTAAGAGRGSATNPPEVAHPRPIGRTEDRLFLAHSGVAISRRSKPVVLGIISDPMAGALAVDAVVNRVTPNDALLVLERSEPDLVLVEAAAFGRSHPWAFAADAAAVERARLLLELIERAHVLGRPAVLVRDIGAADQVGLIPLEPRFDLVLSASQGSSGASGWSRGVQLARFNPLGAAAKRDDHTLLVGGLDPRAPLRERRFFDPVLMAARDHGLDLRFDADAPDGWDNVPDTLRKSVRGRIAWRDLAPLYRRSSVVVANPFVERDRLRAIGARTLEQLACGARIVSGPNQTLANLAGPLAHVVHRPEAAAGVLADALAAGVPTAAEMRSLLRTLFLGHATPVMLSQVTRQLGLSTDPLAGRSTTALATVGADADVGHVVESLTQQIQRPTRAVIRLDDGARWSTDADDALAQAGIEVHMTPASADLSALAELAEEPTTAWLANWPDDGRAGPRYLLDLLVGGEMSSADAVGYQSGDPFRFVSSLGPDAGLLRWESLRTIDGWRDSLDHDPSRAPGWDSNGWRLLSVGLEDVA
jgi:hypothetical protein